MIIKDAEFDEIEFHCTLIDVNLRDFLQKFKEIEGTTDEFHDCIKQMYVCLEKICNDIYAMGILVEKIPGCVRNYYRMYMRDIPKVYQNLMIFERNSRNVNSIINIINGCDEIGKNSENIFNIFLETMKKQEENKQEVN